MWGYGYGYPMMGYGGYGVVGAIFSVLWVIFLFTIIITAIRWVRGKSGGRSRHILDGQSALDILKERYAKGEIDKKEFEEKKHDIAGS